MQPADETDSKVRVFVVDDERVIASTIAVILNQNGDDARPFIFGEGSRETIHLGAPFLLISHLGLWHTSGDDVISN